MKEASSDARKEARLATSSGCPILFSGMPLIIALVFSLPSGLLARNNLVAIGPGPMQLTLILYGASSRAQVRVTPIRPALVAE